MGSKELEEVKEERNRGGMQNVGNKMVSWGGDLIKNQVKGDKKREGRVVVAPTDERGFIGLYLTRKVKAETVRKEAGK